MAEIKIPIFNGVFDSGRYGYGDNGVTSSKDDYEIKNGYLDKNKVLHKRPVMLADGTANPTGRTIIGLHWWSTNEYFIALIMGSGNTSVDVYKVTLTAVLSNYPATDVYTLLGNIPSVTTALAEQYLPTIIEGYDDSSAEVLYINVGATKVYRTDGATLTDISALNGSTLDTVSDIAFINRRLLCNNSGDERVYYSDTAGKPSIFTGAKSITIEGRPDKVVRMLISGQEIIMFGSESIEFWYTTGDDTLPYARYEGGEINRGLPERNALCQVEDDFYFLDRRRKFVLMRNKQIKEISLPIAERLTFGGLANNAFCVRYSFEAKDYVAITYPDIYGIQNYEGQTFVYDITFDKWYKWGDANEIASSTTLEWLPMIPHRCASYSDKYSNQFVASDEIRYFTQLTGHTFKEKLTVTSASIDLDTHARKSSHRITGRVKATTDNILFRYRDGMGEDQDIWTSPNQVPNYTEISISPPSDRFLKLHRMGQYRIRQYQIIHEIGTFHMGDLTEEVEVLGS